MAIVPSLRVFDIYVLKAGIPQPLADIRVYRQGATVMGLIADVVIPNNGSNTFDVYFIGVIHQGDISEDVVVVDGVLANWLKITGVDTVANKITVQNISGHSVTVRAESTSDPASRLSPAVSSGGVGPAISTARVFKDPTGRFAATQPLKSDSAGRAIAYVADFRYDYAISAISGESIPRVFGDAEGSYVMRT